MELLNKHILIVGLGVSGAAAARFLKKRGARVTVTDMASEKQLSPFLDRIKDLDIELQLGTHINQTFENADLIIISPGVPDTILPIINAKEKNVPVWGEIELAGRFIKEPIVAVTGTNGKTTTTTLLGKMIESSGLKPFVGGNIGTPLIEYVDHKEKADVVVAELSSFQLDTIDTFRPKVSVLLNITEDHMDRYTDLEAYATSKGRIFMNQQENDTAVLNGSDPLAVKITKHIKAKKRFFYHDESRDNTSNDLNLFDFYVPGLPGKHNIENASAAALAAMSIGCSLKGIQAALNNFKGLPHRLEYVKTVNDIRFFDDSKATNVDAVARAIDAFDSPIVLIMGGRSKGARFDDLSDRVSKKIKQLIVIGEAKENIISALGRYTKTHASDSMQDAVIAAYQSAASGDIVLLSPACSSFDMFRSYAHRGEIFQKTVGNLN
jgi:UDP-N-acetylmuramoylalanine--D-glutamate ligase